MFKIVVRYSAILFCVLIALVLAFHYLPISPTYQTFDSSPLHGTLLFLSICGIIYFFEKSILKQIVPLKLIRVSVLGMVVVLSGILLEDIFVMTIWFDDPIKDKLAVLLWDLIGFTFIGFCISFFIGFRLMRKNMAQWIEFTVVMVVLIGVFLEYGMPIVKRFLVYNKAQAEMRDDKVVPREMDRNMFKNLIVINNETLYNLSLLDRKNKALLNAIALNLGKDSNKVAPFYKKAFLANEFAKHLCAFTDSVRKFLISKSLNISGAAADTTYDSQLSLQEYVDVSENLMYNDTAAADGSKGIGAYLKIKIAEYRKHLLALIDERDTVLVMNGRALWTPSVFSPLEDKKMTWEYYHFHNKPVLVTIITLSQLKSEIKQAEESVLYQELIYSERAK